ncbi:MAG: hypothetical protein PHN98_02645 [Smithellaceae bacterium]|nr:hypothetical protein [Smithellaceae bacterium]
MQIKTLGFPKIHNFPGDVRDFTPNLFEYLKKYKGVAVYLEQGYGEELGYSSEDYLAKHSSLNFVPLQEVYQQDMIVILKDPELKNLKLMKDFSALFTMIHYDTRPANVELICKKNIKSFSMDAIVDDNGLRMFVDYFGTAYAGCEISFEILKKIRPDFYSTARDPFVATILGAGGAAQACVRAFEMLGDSDFLQNGVPGIISQNITRSITTDHDNLKAVLAKTDILVDATKRINLSIPVISNDILGSLPQTAVIVDLAADRYDVNVNPPIVRAIEGTVKGSPNHKVIYPDDKLYEQVPASIETKNRRITISCDAWPSVNPDRSLKYYEILMKNYLNVLLNKDIETLDAESDDIFERGLYRSSIAYFLSNSKNVCQR